MIGHPSSCMRETVVRLGNMDRTWIIVERPFPPLLDDPVLGGERLGGGELCGAEPVVRVRVVAERLVRGEGRHDGLNAAAAVGRLGLLCYGIGEWPGGGVVSLVIWQS